MHPLTMQNLIQLWNIVMLSYFTINYLKRHQKIVWLDDDIKTFTLILHAYLFIIFMLISDFFSSKSFDGFCKSQQDLAQLVDN